ncbi:unnamed protein product, partial [Allacma fusca]
MSNYSNAFIE